MPAVVATSASRPRRSLWVRARRRVSGDRCRAGWRRLGTGGEGRGPRPVDARTQAPPRASGSTPPDQPRPPPRTTGLSAPSAPRLATAALAGRSGDCGDVAVFEIDGLMQAPTEGGREPDEDVLAGDVALFDLGDPALRD